MTVGYIVVTVNRKDSLDSDVFGAGGDKDDGLVLVNVSICRIAFSYDKVYCAPRATGTAARPSLQRSLARGNMWRSNPALPNR